MQDPAHSGIEVFVGVDVAKGDHYACAARADGAEVLARSVCNDEASITELIDEAAAHGAVALVIDTTRSAAVNLPGFHAGAIWKRASRRCGGCRRRWMKAAYTNPDQVCT